MCGIAGFTHHRARPDPGRIQRVTETLLHRGPDQQGVHESATVSLGATRLKIIDLEAGNQPIYNASRDSVIVFNGEIYNHAELRLELERRGHKFQTKADTEVVLAAFLEWDTDCFTHLRGMFGVAIWTESTRRLVLARDRMGIKPLYYTVRDGDLYFGSELKAIFEHSEIDRRISLAGLDCYLSLNYVPSPFTLVDGVEKLRPGYWLEWRDGVVRSQSYWKLPIGADPHWTIDSARSELDSLLKKSVREHLLSDVPLGLWLSGGVDSSSLLHYTVAASRSRLKTFSVTFPGYGFNEARYIREVATKYNTDHHEFEMHAETELGNAIEEFSYYFDEPNADAGALPVWFLSKMTRQTVTVALSGEGADELFGGYLTYRADHLARRMRRIPGPILGAASALAQLYPVSDEKIGFDYVLKRFLKGCRMAPARAHVYWNGTFSDVKKRWLTEAALPPALDGMLAELTAQGDNLLAYLWFDQRCYLPDDILAKVDRMSMAHSIEVRPPFLDHRIVEFAASLPEKLKIDGKRQKVILRELMKGKLPQTILRRKKMGFDIPAHEWMRGPLRDLLLSTLPSAASQFPGLFHGDRIAECIGRHLDRRANLGYHLWGLLLLFLWMKRWRIQTTQVSEPDRRTPAGMYTSI
ncbi:MAG TPA: asparagine synthase (glutamine-hydrolyzing) [Verrucomicrobiae bacterium]|nr:asparagine synthase (glutamine-hydrolyzing) [Verrucomicrobiae bacterium]